jgi:cob(I)alamin adenosyltransferase
MKMRIYTKTGDAGESGLYTGARLPKCDAVFDCLGTLDELSAFLGVAASTAECPAHVDDQLRTLQGWLLDAGSCVATPSAGRDDDDRKVRRTRFDAGRTTTLERWIDDLDRDLPRLTRFILPSGGPCASHLHVARAVCRRAERALVALPGRERELSEPRIFLNRLSDYLFVAARTSAIELETEHVQRSSSAVDSS